MEDYTSVMQRLVPSCLCYLPLALLWDCARLLLMLRACTHLTKAFRWAGIMLSIHKIIDLVCTILMLVWRYMRYCTENSTLGCWYISQIDQFLCEQCLATHAKDTISGVRTILKPSRIPSPISMLLSMQNILYQRLTLVWFIVNAVLWIQNIQHSIILTSVQIRTRANCKVTSHCCEEYTIRLVAVVLYEFSNVWW